MQILHKEYPFSYISKAPISVLKYSFSMQKRTTFLYWKGAIPPDGKQLFHRWNDYFPAEGKAPPSEYPFTPPSMIRVKVLRLLLGNGARAPHIQHKKSLAPTSCYTCRGEG